MHLYFASFIAKLELKTKLRKKLKDIKILFEFITFDKMISNQSMFVSDRNTNTQFSKM